MQATLKREDTVERLMDCSRQAFLVGLQFTGDNRRGFQIFQTAFEDAAREIALMREFMRKMQSAIEAEGYAIMVGPDGSFVELEDRNES